MIRKILLLLCIAFAVVAFGYPCFVIPFGSYDYKLTTLGETKQFSYSFKFDGTVIKTNYNIETGEKENEIKMYYKYKGNKVILSTDNKFDDNDEVLAIASIYRLGNTAFNVYGCAVAIGVAVVAAAIVVSMPRRRN